jgi:hypothetical protein
MTNILIWVISLKYAWSVARAVSHILTCALQICRNMSHIRQQILSSVVASRGLFVHRLFKYCHDIYALDSIFSSAGFANIDQPVAGHTVPIHLLFPPSFSIF